MNTLDLILSSLPNQLLDVNSPNNFSDHDAIAVTLKVSIHLGEGIPIPER